MFMNGAVVPVILGKLITYNAQILEAQSAQVSDLVTQMVESTSSQNILIVLRSNWQLD